MKVERVGHLGGCLVLRKEKKKNSRVKQGKGSAFRTQEEAAES